MIVFVVCSISRRDDKIASICGVVAGVVGSLDATIAARFIPFIYLR